MEEVIDLEYLKRFLNSNRLGIISTVDEKGLPHAAPIYYMVNDAFEFHFVSPEKTQKSRNLEHSNNIVLPIPTKRFSEIH